MKAVVIIPARYESSRFPGKPIEDILGVPMIIRVADICAKAVGKDSVFIATDNMKIVEVVEKYRYQSIMTSKNALTGTDRVAEAAKKIEADIYINVQGDEPTIKPENIINIIKTKSKYPNYIVNSFYRILKNEDPHNANIPKVVKNEKNFLVYMSRSIVPGTKKQEIEKNEYFKQVCIYGFSKSELDDFLNFGKKSKIEELEDIEILRFFELNKKIFMVEASDTSLAVDEPSDIKKVEEFLLKSNEN